MKTRRNLLLTTLVLAGLLLTAGAVGEIIIDDGDPGTSSTGRWIESNAPGAYGASSLYSGSWRRYTWQFSCPETAEYELSMWWTEWPSRTTRAKILVASDGGTKTIYVNQRENGGKWNALGRYAYTSGKTYDVTIIGAPGNVTTCADAVRFVKYDPPKADFSADRYRGPAPLTIKFRNHTAGDVESWHWDFGDGQTSTADSPSHTYTKPGVHTVMLTATGRDGTDTKMRYSYIDVKAKNTENIYVIDAYGGNDYLLGDLRAKMWQAGAVETADGWVCKPSGSNMTYNIYHRRTAESLKNALYEPDSHVVICGHANYGAGLVFASSREILEQRIDDYDCVDSSRLFCTSTDWVAYRVDGMKYGQAYPNWNAVFKDGGDAVAPMDFGDSRGTPPYNYHLTYQLPGDPTHYRIEINGDYVERFKDSGVPAWYSSDGKEPDPSVDRACFIRNTSQYYNRFEYEGEWKAIRYTQNGPVREETPMNYNYQWQWPGLGSKQAKWTMMVKRAGTYKVLATWPAFPESASNAKYKIHHANGTSVVYADQRQPGEPVSLGVYTFRAGRAVVELDDKADGYLAADAIILRPTANAEKILCAEFSAHKQSGSSPMTVEFTDRSHHYTYNDSAKIEMWEWDFGDGTASQEANPVHTYARPGVYTVRLRVTATDGRKDMEEKKNFIVVDGSTKPVAQFWASRMRGNQGMTVSFHDQSTGDIRAWRWDFGDGKSSEDRNPVHTYTSPGRYSIRLRVYGPAGNGVEIERNYIHVFLGECYTDNSFRVQPHYTSGATSVGKVICYAAPKSFDKKELKYARMFHSSCNSMPYFGQVFDRGLMYGKIGDVTRERDTASDYLVHYLKGDTDEDILTKVNELEDNHVFFNFSEKPPSIMKGDNEADQY